MSCNHINPLDIEAAKEIVDGDINLFKELLSMFLETAPGRLKQLDEFLRTGNMKEAREEAHRIKGSLRNFAAVAAAAKAQKAEDAAERTDVEGAETAFRELADEIEFLGYYYFRQQWKKDF